MKGSSLSLLDCLADKLGCGYLSDLRRQAHYALQTALSGLPTQQFSPEEWADAMLYLTGERPDEGMEAEDLKERLLNRLKGNGVKQPGDLPGIVQKE